MKSDKNWSRYSSENKTPLIYAYTEERYKKMSWNGPRKGKGLIKVGYTTRPLHQRMKEHYPTNSPLENDYEVLFSVKAIKDDGTLFNEDHEVHSALEKKGIHRIKKNNKIKAKKTSTEWFECTLDELKNTILELKSGQQIEDTRVNDFKMRPEQAEAVEKTSEYFKKEIKLNRQPHFLWNAKMRFGKTFTAYQLMKKMGFSKIMVLTYKPAVSEEWKRDLTTHVDFKGWQFFTKDDDINDYDLEKPLCWFASFQDVLGRTSDGKIKERFENAYSIDWDCIILDEYHFGAHNENSKKQFHPDFYEHDVKPVESGINFNEKTFPFESKTFLYLSGTPFRAIRDGEFLEDEIFTWTYMDEQKAKKEWKDDSNNPYADLPEMIIMSYELPDEIKKLALKTDTNQFDLNEFFKVDESAYSNIEDSQFLYKDEVNKWLTFIKGQYLKGGFRPDLKQDIPTPFGTSDLQNYLNHTIWFLPRVSSCWAMKNLLSEINFFDEYDVLVVAGNKAGVGTKALKPVQNTIQDGFENKSILLSCGKLAQGVTIPQLTAVFMLSNISSPESYFQAAFRAQSPWSKTFINEDGKLDKEIFKYKCYIFEFSPNRVLQLVTDYAVNLDLGSDKSSKEKVQKFLDFLPILAYEGNSMYVLDADQALDFAYSGIGMSMLANKWKSALLVNINNETLERLLEYPEIIEALEKMENYVNLYDNISNVVTSEKAINKIKKEGKPLSDTDKKDQKRNKTYKDVVMKACKTFNARIPIFMYLTDFREEALKDVILKLDPGLFYKVTGVEIDMFETLCDIGLLSSSYYDQAIFKFRQAEDASLSYIGRRREAEYIGGFSEKFKKELIFQNDDKSS